MQPLVPEIMRKNVKPIIECSQGSIGIGWQWKDKDYFDLDVSPDTMSWTATLNDTGAGWVSINPATGTGDEINMYANAEQENPNPTPRSCTVTFSDDASEADDLVLTITQAAAPV